MPESDPEAYMNAFMNGFEFVLLAIRGRLEEADLDPSERARLESFLADYHRIAQAYRARRPVEVDGLLLHHAVPTHVDAMIRN